MSSFNEAQQAKLSLKMLLSDYAWFRCASIVSEGDGYIVVVEAARISDAIRRVIPIVHRGVGVKTEVIGRVR